MSKKHASCCTPYLPATFNLGKCWPFHYEVCCFALNCSFQWLSWPWRWNLDDQVLYLKVLDTYQGRIATSGQCQTARDMDIDTKHVQIIHRDCVACSKTDSNYVKDLWMVDSDSHKYFEFFQWLCWCIASSSFIIFNWCLSPCLLPISRVPLNSDWQILDFGAQLSILLAIINHIANLMLQ